MSRSEIEKSIQDLNNLVINGRLLDAFDKYYHEEVAMQENSTAPVIGKSANREREEKFLSNIVEFRSASVQSMAIGDDVSFVIWKYDYTHKEWGVKNYTQVSVQNWKEGKIIKE